MATPKARSWKTLHMWTSPGDTFHVVKPSNHPVLSGTGLDRTIAVHPFGAIAVRFFHSVTGTYPVQVWFVAWMRPIQGAESGPGLVVYDSGIGAGNGSVNFGNGQLPEPPLNDGQWDPSDVWYGADNYQISGGTFGGTYEVKTYDEATGGAANKPSLLIVPTFGHYYLQAGASIIQLNRKVGAIWRGLTADEWKLLKA